MSLNIGGVSFGYLLFEMTLTGDETLRRIESKKFDSSDF